MTWRSLLMFMFILFGAEALGGPVPAWAAEGVIARFPEVPQDVIHQISLSRPGSTPPTQVLATDAGFLDPLRYRLVPARQVAEQQDRSACLSGSPSFSRLIDDASHSIDFVDYPQAEAVLRRARLALGCGPEMATRAALGNMLFLEAVTRIEQERGVGALMEDALSVSPYLEFPSAYTDAVKRVFIQAQQAQAKRGRVQVPLDVALLGDLSLYVDGLKPSGQALTLSPGRHFLQLVTPDGRGVAGMEIMLDATTDPGVWPPPELRPPGRESLAGELRYAALRGNLSYQQESALGDYLKVEDHSWLVLVARQPDTDVYQALWIHPGLMVEVQTITPQRGPAKTSPGLWATVGLAACSAGGMGVALGTWNQGQEGSGTFTQEEIDTLLLRNHLGVGVGISCLLGAGGSAAWTWLLSREGDPQADAGEGEQVGQHLGAYVAQVQGNWVVGLGARW